MAARSDAGRSPQSAAARKTEGSPWEAVLRACGLRPEAQHPRLDGKKRISDWPISFVLDVVFFREWVFRLDLVQQAQRAEQRVEHIQD